MCSVVLRGIRTVRCGPFWCTDTDRHFGMRTCCGFPKPSLALHSAEWTQQISILHSTAGNAQVSHSTECHRFIFQAGGSSPICNPAISHLEDVRPPVQNLHAERQLLQCPECSYCTNFIFAMEDHLSTHISVRPFQCSHCGRRFKRAAHLVEHSRIHTGEKPFYCQLCPLTFTQKASLVRHMRAHEDKKRFRCHFCSMAFARGYLRTNHEIKKHGRSSALF